MQTVRIVQRAGKDGVLHLSIPVGQAETEFEAVVVLQPQRRLPPDAPTDERGWPAGYFAKTFGSIDDDTFVRQSQSEPPHAVDFD